MYAKKPVSLTFEQWLKNTYKCIQRASYLRLFQVLNKVYRHFWLLTYCVLVSVKITEEAILAPAGWLGCYCTSPHGRGS